MTVTATFGGHARVPSLNMATGAFISVRTAHVVHNAQRAPSPSDFKFEPESVPKGPGPSLQCRQGAH